MSFQKWENAHTHPPTGKSGRRENKLSMNDLSNRCKIGKSGALPHPPPLPWQLGFPLGCSSVECVHPYCLLVDHAGLHSPDNFGAPADFPDSARVHPVTPVSKRAGKVKTGSDVSGELPSGECPSVWPIGDGL